MWKFLLYFMFLYIRALHGCVPLTGRLEEAAGD